MTAPADRPNSALLIVDVQVGVMDPSIRRDEVVANVSTLVDQARSAGTLVRMRALSASRIRLRMRGDCAIRPAT